MQDAKMSSWLRGGAAACEASPPGHDLGSMGFETHAA
jgi:hypothetical protein